MHVSFQLNLAQCDTCAEGGEQLLYSVRSQRDAVRGRVIEGKEATWGERTALTFLLTAVREGGNVTVPYISIFGR